MPLNRRQIHGPDCDCSFCRNRYNSGNQTTPSRWEKTKSSVDADSGLNQTDFYSGTIGGTNQKQKVHVAIDELGQVVYVRDEDGTVLYDRKHGIGHLPHDLDWSRF